MTTILDLPERLDYQSMNGLMKTLSETTDDEVIFDAAVVRHMGSLPLQAILSMVKTRAAAGQKTGFRNASDACVDMLSLFGFSPETLTQPESWT